MGSPRSLAPRPERDHRREARGGCCALGEPRNPSRPRRRRGGAAPRGRADRAPGARSAWAGRGYARRNPEGSLLRPVRSERTVGATGWLAPGSRTVPRTGTAPRSGKWRFPLAQVRTRPERASRGFPFAYKCALTRGQVGVPLAQPPLPREGKSGFLLAQVPHFPEGKSGFPSPQCHGFPEGNASLPSPKVYLPEGKAAPEGARTLCLGYLAGSIRPQSAARSFASTSDTSA